MFQLTLPPLLATCSPINGLLKLYAVIPSSFFIYFPRSFLFCHLNVFIGYLRHQLVVHGCFNSEVAVYSCRSVGTAPLFFIPSVKMQSRFPRTTLHHTVHECTASPVLLCSIKPGLAHFLSLRLFIIQVGEKYRFQAVGPRITNLYSSMSC